MTPPIERAPRREHAAVADALASALLADPVYADIVLPGQHRQRALRRFLAAVLRSAPADGLIIDATRDDRGRIVGAAVWQRSAVGRDSAVLAQLPHLPAFLGALGPRGVLRAARAQRVLERHRPVEAHWYLFALGVRPEAQRAGLGTALLQHRLDELDAAGEAAYLESASARDRALLDRLGFVPGAVIQGLASARPVAMFRPHARRVRRAA